MEGDSVIRYLVAIAGGSMITLVALAMLQYGSVITVAVNAN